MHKQKIDKLYAVDTETFNSKIMSGLWRKVFYEYNKNSYHCYRTLRLFSNKEIGYLKSTINQDILFYNLRTASTTQNLLEIISSHHKIMNSKHLMQAFRSLFNLQKTENLSSNDIIRHPTFKTLCYSLKVNVRLVEINELIEALKILSFVGVQSDSTITQTILQMIRQNINNLSLQQIIFLDFLLRQFKSTPLSEALLIALPIIFEIQLPMKVDYSNLSQLTDCLQYASKTKLPDSTVNLLLDAISSNKTINPKSAMSIVWSICDFKHNDSYAPLLKKLLRIVVKHGDEFDISELETILTKLTYRYNRKQYSYYYNEDFFNLVADHVIANDLGFQQSVWILAKFSKVEFSHIGLLDYIASLCHTNRGLISKTDSWNIYNLVTGFSVTDYRPLYWESIKQGILENNNLLDEKRRIEWMKFSTRLAILNIFKPNILEKSLQEDYIRNLLDNGTSENLENFLLLYQTISTIKEEHKNLLPNFSYVKEAMKLLYSEEIEDKFRPLQPALEKGFGGASYVLSNVFTKFGNLLHHVIIMRKGGYPVALNISEEKKSLFLEDLQIPTDSHVVIIFGYDSSYYKLSSNILRSNYSLILRLLESCGYSVFPVSLQNWHNLPDHEKIPYLMQNIRLKNEEFERLTAVQ